jgi:hypothetical protein
MEETKLEKLARSYPARPRRSDQQSSPSRSAEAKIGQVNACLWGCFMPDPKSTTTGDG